MDDTPDMEEALGLRFRPTEEELVSHYLQKKIQDNKNFDDMIPDIDIHTTPPWDIPSLIKASFPYQNDPDEVYFFCRVRFMDPSGKRLQRKDEFGYWKCTGRVRTVKTRNRRRVIGRKNILVYKKGDDPDDAPTEYSMHEYHLNDDLAKDAPTDTRDFVLCALKRNWGKQAKGCSPRKKGKGKGSELEVSNGESPRAKKRRFKGSAMEVSACGTPNGIICPVFSPTGCTMVNAEQVVEEPIAEIMQNIEVSTPSAIESPQSILSPSLNSANTSPVPSPMTFTFMEREGASFPNTEAPSSHDVIPKEPEKLHEGCTGDLPTTYEENPIGAFITGAEIADSLSIEVPCQDATESTHPLPEVNNARCPLHNMQTELGAEYGLPEDLDIYLRTEEPPPNIFELLGSNSCNVHSGEI